VRDGTRLGLMALAVAALLGLLGDLLLRAIPWGVNAPLWLLALVAAGGGLLYLARVPLLGEGRWLALVALLFAAGIALRDSQALLWVNVLAVGLTLGLSGHRGGSGWPRIGGLMQYLGALASAGFHACGGVLVLAFFDIHWKEVPRTGSSAVVLAVLRGLLIAIPLLVLFGGLFMAADAVFSGIVTNVLSIDPRTLFLHLFWWGVWAWLSAGFFRQVLFYTAIPVLDALRVAAVDADGTPSTGAAADAATASTVAAGDAPATTPVSAPVTAPAVGLKRAGGRVGFLGIVELGVVLGLLDLLFLAFVLVQFRYLFGGAELVQVSATLTYAEYARRGFFELVAVAALLLPMMLFLDWLARLDTPRATMIYRVLAGLLVALLFVVIVSALQRMRLYTQEYGLTELRLYTTAFMFWISTGAVWYLATVLRDQREKYLFGAMLAGLSVAAILNLMNPDDLIVRTNAGREDASSRFDGEYTLLLSADAAPAVIEALPYMSESQQVSVARRLLQRWEKGNTEDWRSWNYGRWRAYLATAENEAQLRDLAARQPPRTDSAPSPATTPSGSPKPAATPAAKPSPTPR